uniref:Uncharacterized protein n=1 Tax=Chenopodium quinoa TaxID=63459 RepID=A0A803MVN0_CHEQI
MDSEIMEKESEEGSCSNASTTTNVAENLPSLKGPSLCYTPRGTKEFILCCPPELKPTLGKFLFEIPRQYVLHRWTKEAMKKPIFGLQNLLDGAEKDKKQKLVGDLWTSKKSRKAAKRLHIYRKQHQLLTA